MSFTEWLNENILHCRKLPTDKRDGTTILLEEIDDNVEMKVRIEGVSKSAIVIRFDRGRRWQIFSEGKEYGRRCDYLILDETDLQYNAIFVELKNKIPAPDYYGEKQLLWSLPYLKYLLFVFGADTESRILNKKLVTKYFQFGNDERDWFKKRRVSEHFKERTFKGISVHCSTRDKFDLKELLRR